MRKAGSGATTGRVDNNNKKLNLYIPPFLNRTPAQCGSSSPPPMLEREEPSPGSSSSSRHVTQFSKMNDSELLENMRFLKMELTRRQLEDPMISPYDSSPEQDFDNPPPLRKVAPKVELTEENPDSFCLLDINNPGISYDVASQSYSYQALPMDADYQNTEWFARQTNKLNGVVDDSGKWLKKGSKRGPIGFQACLRQHKAELEKKKVAEKAEKKEKPVPVVEKKKTEKEPEYKCTVCLQKFKSIASLLDHRAIHGAETMLTCEFCDKRFSRKSHIHQHLNWEWKLFCCSTCSAAFPNAGNLQNHVLTCSSEPKKKEKEVVHHQRSFPCPNCSRTYYSPLWLEKHKSKCEPEEEETRKRKSSPIEVEKDSKQDEEKENKMKINIQRRRGVSTRAMKRSPEVFVEVKRASRSYKEDDLCCPKCRKYINSKRLLEKHLKSCGMSWECAECKQSFASSSILSDHSKQCGGSNSRNDVFIGKMHCELCNRTFLSVHGLKKHERTCEGPEAKKAKMTRNEEDDDDGFVNLDNNSQVDDDVVLDQIQSYVAPAPRNMTMMCSICMAAFYSVADLMNHRSKEHGIQKMFECGICEQTFDSRSSIRRHLNMEYHVFECQVCNMNCREASVLKKHKCTGNSNGTVYGPVTSRPKRELKMLPCVKCGERFRNATWLYSHGLSCDGTLKLAPMKKEQEQKLVEQVEAVIERAEAPVETVVETTPHPKRAAFEKSYVMQKMKPEMEVKEPIKVDSEEGSSSGPAKELVKAPTERTKMKCFECMEEFSKRSKFHEHRKRVHNREEDECSSCSKKFGNFRTLMNHMTVKAKIYTCSECGMAFGRRYQRDFHQNGMICQK